MAEFFTNFMQMFTSILKFSKSKGVTANPKIAVFGQYKTGTTACFLKIKYSLNNRPIEYFEEPYYEPHPQHHSHSVLAKVIIPPSVESYAKHTGIMGTEKQLSQMASDGINSFLGFDKKILIVRDPRDWVISSTLFLPQSLESVYENDKILREVIKLIKEKEKHPRLISVLRLLSEILQESESDTCERLEGLINYQHGYIFDFHSSGRNLITWKYEDMISNNSKHVNKNLGFPLKKSSPSEKRFSHVARSKTYGDWRQWFLPSDVDFFKPLLHKYIKTFGYDQSWQLVKNAYINPEHGSEYVIRTVDLKRV